MAYFPVVLDTCVLYPALIRDVLLSLAAGELYEPLWTEEIVDELSRNLNKRKPPPNVERLLRAMTSTFPDSSVTGYEELVAAMTCHPKDRHVLAAAVHAGAQVIVTTNVKDFPSSATEPYDLQILTPDDFTQDQFDVNKSATCSALQAMADRRRCTLPQLLQELKDPRQLPNFATEACRYIATKGW